MDILLPTCGRTQEALCSSSDDTSADQPATDRGRGGAPVQILQATCGEILEARCVHTVMTTAMISGPEIARGGGGGVPVEMLPSMSCSEARPPRAMHIMSVIWAVVIKTFSLGRYWAKPKAAGATRARC